MRKRGWDKVLAVAALGGILVGLIAGWFIAYFSGIDATITALVSAAGGLLIAIAVPIWQTYWVHVPNLNIEISSIARRISDSATISIRDDPEMKVLGNTSDLMPRFYISYEDLENSKNRSGETLAGLDTLLERAKGRLRDLPREIEEHKSKLEQVQALSATTLTKFQVATYNAPLNPEVDYDPGDHQAVIDDLQRAYEGRLKKAEKDYNDLQANLPAAERKLIQLRADLEKRSSLFTVSASLINSGRSNTAIKVPALLRVLIGQGNYIDIKLTLKDFEEKSEIPANGTRIAVFESLEISSLPEEDRTLINTYWGQSVRAWLLVEDIHGAIAKSNYIAFAEGLYQKIIYDRLAKAAS